MNEQIHSESTLAKALVLTQYMPVMVDSAFAPLLWIDPAQQQEVIQWQERALAIGGQMDHLSFLKLLSLYGKIETEWTYHRGRDFQALFLSLQVTAPASNHPLPPFPALRANVVLAFNITEKATRALLKSIVTSRSLLLHFSAAPTWVTTLPPLRTGRSHDGGHAQEILQLIRTSVPIGFTRASILDLQTELAHFS